MKRRNGKSQERQFADRFDSRIGAERADKKEGRPFVGRANDMTRNDRFIESFSRPPEADQRLVGRPKIAHVGEHGAPTIYNEKPGGRRRGRGKRT